MLTEPSKFIRLAYAKVPGGGVTDSKEDGLTDKREKDHIVGEKGEVKPALTISRVRGVIRWRRCRIGDEEEGGEGARWGMR